MKEGSNPVDVLRLISELEGSSQMLNLLECYDDKETIDEIKNGKIATFDFDRLILDPLKIALRRSRPLVGIKIDDEKIRWPEALGRGDISNLVLKDMVNSQIACSEDVDIEKFPQNLQNGFNRTKRIVNG